MTTCAHCGKQIKGNAVRHVPTLMAIMLGIDTERSYHPACHVRAENAAYKAKQGSK